MTEMIHKTESLCPKCLQKIAAEYVLENGKVYYRKACPEHGEFKTLFWNDANMYAEWMDQSVHAEVQDRGRPEKKGCPSDCGLCDQHEGGTCTAVLEITYRCNMNCSICFADSNQENFEPDIEKITKMYRAALASNPNCSVQLSGGEPTMRDDLPEIVRRGKELDILHLQINTNGIRIAEDIEYLRRLKEAGADLIYLQFDGTREDVYRKIRGRDMMEIKIKAIENCGKVGIGVLLVPVVIPSVNLDNLGDIYRFAKAHIPTVKGIHFQPVSYFGRFPWEVPEDADRCGLCDVIQTLVRQSDGELRTEHFVPRKRFDPHCAFSSTFFLAEDNRLMAISDYKQNADDTEKTDFALKTNAFTIKRWRMNESGLHQPQSELRKFTTRTLTHSFSITGMGFQDVWNIDINRLKGCCVHVVTSTGDLVPLCAFHLTSVQSERLYMN